MKVLAVSKSARHQFSKQTESGIRLLAGRGVEGDAHAGVTVQHLSRIAKNPQAPNLRQVHLIHGELISELAQKGMGVAPGQLGENVLTEGVDLLGLPVGTRLSLGATAVVEITGLRNPCKQLDGIAPGLLAAVLDKDAQGNLVRKCGVMAIVVAGGEVAPGDAIVVTLPSEPHRKLEPV